MKNIMKIQMIGNLKTLFGSSRWLRLLRRRVRKDTRFMADVFLLLFITFACLHTVMDVIDVDSAFSREGLQNVWAWFNYASKSVSEWFGASAAVLRWVHIQLV